MEFQKDCRFFSGYKPCSLHHECTAHCPAKKVGEPRVLIIHLEALGAVLRGTVVLRAIKRKWPNSHITWITSVGAAPLLENNHLIDRLLKNDHQGAMALSTLAFDYGFCVDKSLVASGLLQVPVEIKEKRGFGTLANSGGIVPLNIEAQRLYELGLSNHEKFFVNKKPETQLIIESLGLDFQNDEYVFDFSLNDLRDLESARENLSLKSFSHPVIGLNTGCSPTIPFKKFSVSGWVKLIDILRLDFPKAKILLLGGPEDTARNNEIKALRPGSSVLTPTSLGLRSGLQYVNLCDVVVTGDSLGMHMAIALKKWVVAWFGPTCSHEIDLYRRGMAIETSAPCSPCWKRECDKPVMCYDQVDFKEISRGVSLGLKSEKVFATVARKTSRNFPLNPSHFPISGTPHESTRFIFRVHCFRKMNLVPFGGFEMRDYDLKLDQFDGRDLLYKRSQKGRPKQVDLRKNCSAVENQGQIGSCTANALVGNLEFLEKAQSGKATDLSRLFIYYNERFIEHHEGEDSGATLRDGIKALKNYGTCSEALWPYDEKLLLKKPDLQAYAEGEKRKISKYERLKNLDDMRDCLAQGFPFVFGIKVFESFESLIAKDTGFIPRPQFNEKFLGGHALLAVGYNDDRQFLIIRNSWGKSWGKGGYGFLPYDYFTLGLTLDYWTIQK